MSYSTLDALAELDRTRGSRPPPKGQGQVAAVNLLPLVDEVMELAKLGRKGEPRPGMLPEDIYPGRILPPGDVVPVEHRTMAEGFSALDPARRPAATAAQEGQGPAEKTTDYYLHGQAPEGLGEGERAIQGAVPGMYNVETDPDKLLEFVRQREAQRRASSGMMETTMPGDDELREDVRAELRRRGYAGEYSPAAGLARTWTPVDVGGAAPNIDGMRFNLNLPVAPVRPEVEFAPRSPFAQVNTETQPGAAWFADRYRLYKDDPTAAAYLHADYERLLRNPDGSSVVADMLGVSNSSQVRQAQGVYKGQLNPVAGARIEVVAPPQINPLMDPDEIAEVGNLSAYDRARLDAVAVTEGTLRNQDAVAWAYPVYMADESAISTQGLPWEAVNAAIFRSPKLRQKEVAMVGKALNDPLPADVKKVAEWGNTWEETIAVTEPADGSGGIMLTNLSLPPKVFQEKVRELRKRFPTWESNRGMRTEWGRGDTGYHEWKDYTKVTERLPQDIRDAVIRALDTLRPYTQQIGDYHAKVRDPGVAVIPDVRTGTRVAPQQPGGARP